MWITEIGNFIATSSFKVAVLIAVSSLIILVVPPDFWFPWLGFENPHKNVVTNFGGQIFIAFVVSLAILIFAGISWLLERMRNRGRKLQIIKATYGTNDNSIDVTSKVKALVKNNSLNFIVDDDKLLKPGKIDDPIPGSDKTLKIEYTYKHTKKYEKGKPVVIGSQND